MQINHPDRNQEKLISIIDALKKEHEDLQSKYAYLQFEYNELKRLVFGSKSERFSTENNAAQLKLLENVQELLEIQGEPVIEEESNEEKYHDKRTEYEKIKPSRNRIPDHFKREDIIIEPDQDISGWVNIGKQITEQLDYKPAELIVKRYIRTKYAHPTDPDQGIVIGALPSFPIAKGKAGSGLITKVIIDKYVDHLPCYRQEQIYARQGLALPRSTLCDWIAQSADLLQPLYELFKKKVLSSGYIQVDESPIPVQSKDKSGATHRGYMWVYQAVNEDLVFFDYQPSKEGQMVAKMLTGYKGYLQTDGYAAYEMFKSTKQIKTLHCWAHARRYFHKALDNDKKRAEYALRKIGELYLLERTMKKDWPEIDDYHIKDLRQRHALPILLELENWLRENLHLVKPKSAIGKAILYTLKRFKELKTYTSDGRLNIDNNPVERSIRPMALGRKNYLFAGSHAGARRAAIMYTLVGTCKLRKVNPFDWLKDTLEKIPDTSIRDLQKLLP